MNKFKKNRRNNNRSTYVPKDVIVFVTLHLIPFLAIFTGATLFDWVIFGVLYFIRMFFITAGYHRYFSHRSFQTSRWFQFFLAFMAQTSLQKGALWWASVHRVHHRHSDTEEDPHSMHKFGFIYSHLGWILSRNYKETRYNLIRDFSKYPELVWLNKNHVIPPVVLALVVFVAGFAVNGGMTGGLSALLIGFFASTIVLYHATYSINSLMHLIGSRRYKTTDKSRNNLILALVTLGEGWHNNHHHYMASTRQGFFWWEIDITYYILKMFSWMGLVKNLRGVPGKIKYSYKQQEETKTAA